ncbi:MAG: type IX secretion system membrane protein PorP/SprF [Bacteroidota bacterium]
MKYHNNILRFLLVLSGLLPSLFLIGQDVPSKLLSIPVFHPMVFNPAIAGSKDFTNINLTSKAINFTKGQLISMHTRLATPEGDYSHFGFGAYAFQEQLIQSWHTGLAVTGAYHYWIDDEHLHNLAVGVAAKGFFMVPKTGEVSDLDSSHTVFRPNMDAGIYYYGPQGFGGLSVTTLFDTDFKGDSSLLFSTIDRQYHLFGGYKFVINKKLRIVIEPSLLVSLDDETLSEPIQHLVPYLKLYLQNFYLGTYLKDFDIFALFFQYQFPKFYTGVFLEFPRVGYLNDNNIIFEVSVGLNLGQGGPAFLQYRHW